MSTMAMKGVDFDVKGVVTTPNGSYAVLMDEGMTSYFPIPCQPFHGQIIEGALSEKDTFNLDNYGLYFTLLSLFKAHDMKPTQISLSISSRGTVTCFLEVVEQNELGSKVSRIPMVLSDAVVVGVLGKIPMVVYGVAGTDIAFAIGKGVPKQNVFSFVCDEIAKSERMSAIDAETNDQR